jgi:hypothetical protein
MHRALSRAEAHSGFFFLAPPSRQSGERSSRSFRFNSKLLNDLRSTQVQFCQDKLHMQLNLNIVCLTSSDPNKQRSWLIPLPNLSMSRVRILPRPKRPLFFGSNPLIAGPCPSASPVTNSAPPGLVSDPVPPVSVRG